MISMPVTSPCACGRIDVHAHFMPECYTEALAQHGLGQSDGGFPFPAWSAEAAIATMDRLEIATAIISVSSPSVNFLPVAGRPALCRAVNLAGHQLAVTHAGRFGLFASLPLPDIDAALKEIAFAFDDLGADGIVLETNINGEYLGSPRFAPVFAELNRRAAVLFVHPTSPVCPDSLMAGRPAPLIEFPFDTTRCFVDLLYRRVIQANPQIRFIVPHAGGALSALAARIASFANVPFIAPRPASEAEVFEALRGLYYDLALSTHPSALTALRGIAPLDHILFGSDWPFAAEANVAHALTQLLQENGLDDGQIAALTRGNAEALFPRLASRTGS